MNLHPVIATNVRTILASSSFQQLAPLFVVFLVPLLVLSARTPAAALLRRFCMVFESLGLGSLWSWGGSSQGSTSPKKLKKKHVRSRADQLAHSEPNGDARHDDGYYPGLVNISGTYCFMDSTLQALASLSYLKPQLDAIQEKAEVLDVPTHVVDALRDLLHYLNTPKSNPTPLRPTAIIAALSAHSAHKQSALFSSREHQDAQELFQLVSECIKDEATAVMKEGLRDRGFGGVPPPPGLGASSRDANIARSVFDGLTANRRSCVECGYTEAVMHFGFDSWQLTVPRQGGGCRLEDCIEEYTKLELLTDCVCRKCSLVATHRKLANEAIRLSESTEAEGGASHSKRKRAREARKLEMRVRAALEEGRIEDDIKGVTLERVYSKASTKQAMVARPPPVLALHLNRSIHYGHYAGKNTASVVFPELLDLTPYTTSGTISTQPSLPISSSPSPHPLSSASAPFYVARSSDPDPERASTPTPASARAQQYPQTLYRLAAVVAHYGQHSFGHYVCYRRKPRAPSAGARRFDPPRLACPLGCVCAQCTAHGPVRDAYSADAGREGWLGGSGGWLRISDDDVREVPLAAVLAEASGAFMLYYERVLPPAPAPLYALRDEPRSSEETVRPHDAESPGASVNGSAVSMVMSDGGAEAVGRRVGARVVRSVSTAHVRSFSPAPFALASAESVVTLNDVGPAPDHAGLGPQREPAAPANGAMELDLPPGPGQAAPVDEPPKTTPASEASPPDVDASPVPRARSRSSSPASFASPLQPSPASPSQTRRRLKHAAPAVNAARSPPQPMHSLPVGLHA